ncbi:MAG TPA: [protein-PII] uridylyltransferase, partial [Alcanivorax sp.]|nr:[protein-PII] uridylyltransferase [Alcanivorax sp.]
MNLDPPMSQDSLLDTLRDSDQPGLAAREFLEAGQARLDEAFHEAPITELVHGRARLVDRVLIAAWSLFGLDRFDETALVAVGGYGRGELHPHSDVDLMVLFRDAPNPEACSALEGFVAFLWDIGLEIGHSVRTLDECVSLAGQDITVATNIMEARTLAGDDRVRADLAVLTGPDAMWPNDRFFAAKWEEQTARHRKFNDTEYNLEPDIKNAPGGLRDVQMIAWVAKRHFGADSLEALVDAGFLTADEHRELSKCLESLWRIRWQLHGLTGRNE